MGQIDRSMLPVKRSAMAPTAAGVAQLVAGELTLVADLGYAPVFFVLGAHPRAGVRRFGLVSVAGSACCAARSR